MQTTIPLYDQETGERFHVSLIRQDKHTARLRFVGKEARHVQNPEMPSPAFTIRDRHVHVSGITLDTETDRISIPIVHIDEDIVDEEARQAEQDADEAQRQHEREARHPACPTCGRHTIITDPAGRRICTTCGRLAPPIIENEEKQEEEEETDEHGEYGEDREFREADEANGIRGQDELYE